MFTFLRLFDRFGLRGRQVVLVMAYQVIECHRRNHRRVAERLKFQMTAVRRALQFEDDQVPCPVDPERIDPPPGVGEGSELLRHDQHVVELLRHDQHVVGDRIERVRRRRCKSVRSKTFSSANVDEMTATSSPGCISNSGIRRPFVGEGFHLAQDQVGGVVTAVRRVAVLGQEALDRRTDLGADVIAGDPVGGDVPSQSPDQVTGDGSQVVGAHLGDGGLVLGDGVVEGQLVVVERRGEGAAAVRVGTLPPS